MSQFKKDIKYIQVTFQGAALCIPLNLDGTPPIFGVGNRKGKLPRDCGKFSDMIVMTFYRDRE
jgi:hypothetical protein